MELELVKFIKGHSDWEELLTQEPYALTIKRKDNFVMFSYNQIESDFNQKIVRECRGLILEDLTFKPLCVPFYKFFNLEESYADKIDWSTAMVNEKLDGSLIKLWYYDYWRVSTNGCIDARDANLDSDIYKYKNFLDLFVEAVKNSVNDWNADLDTDCTYMFELTSPYNRVVVPHKHIKITHIGTRNNKTLEETFENVGVDQPILFRFQSIEDCLVVAKTLPFDNEGYVIVDAKWNRVKVKSPAYVAVHHLRNNGVVTKKRIVDLIKLNEDSEFLAYYPEFTESTVELRTKIDEFIKDMDWAIETAKVDKKLENRKRFAEFAKTTKCPPIMFSYLDGKINSAEEWIHMQTSEKILDWIGVK